MRNILLNPGPVTLSESVRAAAVRTDLCHREPEFAAVQEAVINGLLAVYACNGEDWAAVPLGGSGTVAMEAMLASAMPRDGRLLVVENGVYGERLSRIAEIHRIPCETDRYDWGGSINPERIARRLAGGSYSHLAVVHHETTTGRLNDVGELADRCLQHGVQLLVDAVSSFGVEQLPFSHGALAACAGTANKCLHGIPGLAFVLLRRRLLDADVPVRSLYLHLPDWARLQALGSTPFTPPVNAFLALEQALEELRQQGGWQARRRRYAYLAEQVRAALRAHGVEPWLPPAESSCALRSYGLAGGLNYNHVHDGFKRQGFVIYAGQGGLSEKMFRISTMGDISDEDLRRLRETIDVVFGRAPT